LCCGREWAEEHTRITDRVIVLVIIDRWRKAWQLHAFRNQCALSVAILIASLVILRLFLDHVETGRGVVLDDPILPYLPALDLKWITYAVTYSGILLGIASLCFYPFAFLLAVRSSILVVVFRVLSLITLPLDPPAGMVPLVDPIMQLPFAYPNLTRDLFFSWQTAAMTLFALTVEGKDMKLIFSVFAVLVSLLLLLQHAQYTISVAAAPCFVYAAYGIAKAVTVGASGPGIPGTR